MLILINTKLGVLSSFLQVGALGNNWFTDEELIYQIFIYYLRWTVSNSSPRFLMFYELYRNIPSEILNFDEIRKN